MRLPFPTGCFVSRDFGPILWGDQNWRHDWNLTCFALRKIDDAGLNDGEVAAHFDSPSDSDRDFEPSLQVDRLASDLRRIPDSDIPRGPGWWVGDLVLGHVFGERTAPPLRGDIYAPDSAFQNIYLREVAVRRE